MFNSLEGKKHSEQIIATNLSEGIPPNHGLSQKRSHPKGPKDDRKIEVLGRNYNS